jgi:hypothetical protein
MPVVTRSATYGDSASTYEQFTHPCESGPLWRVAARRGPRRPPRRARRRPFVPLQRESRAVMPKDLLGVFQVSIVKCGECRPTHPECEVRNLCGLSDAHNDVAAVSVVRDGTAGGRREKDRIRASRAGCQPRTGAYRDFRFFVGPKRLAPPRSFGRAPHKIMTRKIR